MRLWFFEGVGGVTGTVICVFLLVESVNRMYDFFGVGWGVSRVCACVAIFWYLCVGSLCWPRLAASMNFSNSESLSVRAFSFFSSASCRWVSANRTTSFHHL